MALNVGLITGHGDGEHVTSFDARAFNRSMFGKGKYILQDAENLKVQVSALTGTIQVSAGSCLWSGMHIRVEEDGAITYTTPASTDYVYVWLHYIRNPENLVESVEITTTTSSKPDVNLIVDTLGDDVTEAYTLFCSFIHDTATNTAQNISNEFQLRQSLDDTAKSQTTSISALQKSVTDQVQDMTELVESSVAENNQKIDELTKSIFADIGTNWTVLAAGRLNTTMNLSEPLDNFAMFIVFAEYSGRAVSKLYTRQSFLYSMGCAFDAMHQTDDSLVAISFTMMTDVNGFASNKFKVSKNYSAKHSDKGTLGGGYTQEKISDADIYIRIMGIGRVKEA